MVIRTPTVFVLGAGASKDFEFPLGFELVHNVIDGLRKDKHARGEFLKMMIEFGEAALDDFLKTMDASSQNSVDAFLEHRRAYMEIGKAAMSMMLIKREREHELYRERDPFKHWMRYLLHQIRGQDFEEFWENKISFVTFNYDRSLEYFLHRALTDSYDKPPDYIWERMQKEIPIVHVHGRLGHFPWEGSGGRDYTPQVTVEGLHLCIKDIKIMHEGAEVATPEFDRAKKLLAEARRVRFLGVGFNNLNMQRLGVMSLGDGLAEATCVGLSAREHKQLTDRLIWAFILDSKV